MLYLASNKSDLLEEIDVTKREGKELAERKNLVFFETSAKENVGI